MALKPLEIYKYLPKTNCKECGLGTCLAFAMNLSSGQILLDKCPRLNEESKKILSQETRPPIKTIQIGDFSIGGETVMFRHEKKFVNQTALCLLIEDDDKKEDISKKLKWINEFKINKLGKDIALDMVALKSTKGDSEKFCELVEYVSQNTKFPLMYICDDTTTEKALKIHNKNTIIFSANINNYKMMAELSIKYDCKLVASAQDFNELSELVGNLRSLNVKEIILNLKNLEKENFAEQIKKLTILRRFAIKEKIENFGFPVITFPSDEISASAHIMKYSSIVVLNFNESEKYKIYPLIALRQNIYTDPQKPLQMEAKVYEINNPDENSILLLTTNFSLTYFTVSQDLEATKVPCHLLVIDSQGQSVLTALASDELNAERVAKFVQETDIKNKVNHKNLIIPGLVPMLSGDIEEKTGLKVFVGPKNSSDLKKYLKELKT